MPGAPVGSLTKCRATAWIEERHGMWVLIQLYYTRLNVYIYDYCRKRNFQQSARAFFLEAQVPAETIVPIDAPEGFLYEWWTVFWDVFSAKANKSGSREAVTYVDVRMIFLLRNGQIVEILTPRRCHNRLKQSRLKEKRRQGGILMLHRP